VLGSGCCGHRSVHRFIRQAPGEAWIRTELIFGLGMKENSTIQADQWKFFLDTEVTPRFPDGLTVLDGYGQWRNPQGVVTAEPSKILVLLHPPDPAAEGKIEEIRAHFKSRFHQDSVLRDTSASKVSF